LRFIREVPRWKKCSTMAYNLSNELCSDAHELNDKKKQLVLMRFLEKDHVKCLLLEFVKGVRDVEHKMTFFDSLKATYVQLVA
jgi:hypothetical protein